MKAITSDAGAVSIRNRRSVNQKLIIFSFVVVPVGLLLLLLIFPTLQLIHYSLVKWNGFADEKVFVGLKNYQAAFQDTATWIAFRNNLLYFVGHLLTFPFCILIASLLNSGLRGSTGFRSLIFLPYIINGVAVAYIFQQFFAPSTGAMNALLTLIIGEDPKIGWFSDPKIVNFTLVLVSLWRWTGFNTILFLAGLQAIPEEQYEAAQVDGATWMQQQRYITLPGVSTILKIALFLNARGALQLFDTPFLITGGGPGKVSSTFTLLSIKTAFQFKNFGLASALAILLISIILTLAFVQNKIPVILQKLKERSSA